MVTSTVPLTSVDFVIALAIKVGVVDFGGRYLLLFCVVIFSVSTYAFIVITKKRVFTYILCAFLLWAV